MLEHKFIKFIIAPSKKWVIIHKNLIPVHSLLYGKALHEKTGPETDGNLNSLYNTYQASTFVMSLPRRLPSAIRAGCISIASCKVNYCSLRSLFFDQSRASRKLPYRKRKMAKMIRTSLERY